MCGKYNPTGNTGDHYRDSTVYAGILFMLVKRVVEDNKIRQGSR